MTDNDMRDNLVQIDNKTMAEYDQLNQYRRRIVAAVNYHGNADHEDVISILMEYQQKCKAEAYKEFAERFKKICE